jgi:hypothetical protein
MRHNDLRDEIRDKITSAMDIERYCPDKWKKKTKPKNDLSFSDKQVEGKPEQQIAVTRDGKSVMMSDTEAHPGSSNGINGPHDQSKQNGIGTSSNNEERTMDADTKEEPTITHSLTGEIGPVNKQSEDLIDRKENFVSHIPMSFDSLRKDMDALSQRKRAGNIFFKVSVELRTHMVEIEFCGNTKHKNRMMISTGKGILEEAN